MKLLFIPDTQVRVGVNLDHIAALGNYIVDKKPEIIVMIGDWFDMPSLSSYEKKGSKYFEGLRYKDDVDVGLHAMDLLFKPMWQYNDMRVRNKKRPYKPRLVFFEGNHENRQTRAINEDPRLIGTIGFEDFQLEKFGWEVHRFLKIVEIEGVLFSHYFVNPDSLTGSVVTGSMENKLKLIGHSFAMGHQQKRQYANRYTGFGKEMHGLVLGAFYSHDESYMNPQGNTHHWRGICVMHELTDGRYDPSFVSLDFLVNKWV